jgi:hypothetical protein
VADQSEFLVALRVLGRLGIGIAASPADERVLPSEARLGIEAICYLILKRELNVPKRIRRRRASREEPSRVARAKAMLRS